MNKTFAPLAALAAVALIGCGNEAEQQESGSSTPAVQEKAVSFSECMREHGVGAFPDPDPSGELTVDAVANEARVDTSTATFERALRACKDLQPSGFTGRKRTAEEQKPALKFAQCMRDNGIEDFPDPVKDGPLIDTTRIPSAKGRGALAIPGFTEAQEKCGELYGDELGLPR